jgi:choline kinase
MYLNCASTSPSSAGKSMPWYYIPCKYQMHVKQQEGRIRHLKKELKAVRLGIFKLKTGNVTSDFMEQDNSRNWNETNIPTPGPIGSLQMMIVKFI